MISAVRSIGRAHCPAFCRLSIGQKNIPERVTTAHMFNAHLDHPINGECTSLFWDKHQIVGRFNADRRIRIEMK
jgi:hypothetical protein